MGYAIVLVLSLAASICGALVWYWRTATYDLPYVTTSPEDHIVRQIDSNTLIVRREFRITRNVEVTVIREMMKTDNGVITRVEVPGFKIKYTPGAYSVERVYDVPNLPKGDYVLKNTICWEANPIRTDCVTLPLLNLKVEKE